MARSIPHPWTGHDPDAFRPLSEITSAPWVDLGGGINTALAFVGAASVVHDGWADEQADSNEAGWTLQLRYDIPPAPSPRHTDLRVTVWAAAPSGGLITVRETTEGNWTLMQPGAGFGATTALVPTGAFDDDGVLELRVMGDVYLRGLDVEFAASVPGAWPGGGELAGPLSADVDIMPFELTDAVSQMPLSARVLTDARAAVEHAAERVRTYLNVAAPRIGGGAIVRPIRAAAPVPSGGTELTIKVRAEGGTEDGQVWVQTGQGGRADIYRQRNTQSIVGIEVPAEAAEALYTITRPLRAERLVQTPQRYPGFSWLTVWASPDVRLLSTAMWGR